MRMAVMDRPDTESSSKYRQHYKTSAEDQSQEFAPPTLACDSEQYPRYKPPACTVFAEYSPTIIVENGYSENHTTKLYATGVIWKQYCQPCGVSTEMPKDMWYGFGH